MTAEDGKSRYKTHLLHIVHWYNGTRFSPRLSVAGMQGGINCGNPATTLRIKKNNLGCEPALQFIPYSWHVIMEAKLGVTSAVLCRR